MLYDTLPERRSAATRGLEALTGLLLGVIGVAVMLTPWQLTPGLVFDTRSILLSLAGMFYGSLATAIAVLLTVALRIFQGGVGMPTGVMVILTSAGIGVLWRWLRGIPQSWSGFYFFGVLVHINMLIWMLILPMPLALRTLQNISLPVMLIYPVGTVLLGLLLLRKKTRRQNKIRLQENEERQRQVLQRMPVMLNALDENSRFIVWNKECERVTGYSAEEIVGNPDALALLYPETATRQEMQAGFDQPAIYFRDEEWDLTTKSGEQKTISWSNISEKVPISGWHTWAVGIDVTDRVEALKALRASLLEKETLLRELYHRTKNNMQVISSLLGLQSARVSDLDAHQVLQETQKHIQAMALVHEMLCRSQDLSRLDLAEYIQELSQRVFASYPVSPEKVEITYQLSPVETLMDTAVPCGLILSELLANSLEHAFSDGRPGLIRISLARLADGRIRFELADNGAGFPENFNSRESDSFGLQMIYAIAEYQLQGEVEFDNLRPGVGCRITLSDDLYQERV